MRDLTSPLDGLESPFGTSRGFTPYSLFSSGQQGFWYDPSDFSTMFQDAAGTTPVTATGQAVGLIRDKSGKGNHASQASATSRPLLQQDASGFYYLSFDGSNDSLATAAIDFTATDKMSLCLGVRKNADGANAIIAELSVSRAANAGSFALLGPGTNVTGDYLFRSRGSIDAVTAATPASYAAPITNVLTCLGDISGDVSNLRINGALVVTGSNDQGTGNYGNYALYIGQRGGTTLTFSGRIYSMVGVGSALSASQIASTEAWVNAKTGAF